MSVYPELCHRAINSSTTGTRRFTSLELQQLGKRDLAKIPVAERIVSICTYGCSALPRKIYL